MNGEDQNSTILRKNDPLLLPFLTSQKGETSQDVLIQLFEEYADPICSKIVSVRTRGIWGMTYCKKENLREDLKQEARLKILSHLRFLQENPLTEPIYDFRNYVARITHNLLHDYFRTEFRPATSFQNREIQLPPNEVKLTEREELASNHFLPDFAIDFEDEEERIFRLKRVWLEVRELPIHQAAAWLLKVSDQNDQSTLKWLPVFQIATVREIAQATGLSPESLANLWMDLPLPDRRIAELFGVTPRQVINWRKSANERLYRRLKTAFVQEPKKNNR